MLLVLASAGLVVAAELAIAACSPAGLAGILERNRWSMLLNVGVISAAAGLLWAATNRLGVSLALMAAGLLFTSTLHIRKLQLIGRPLLPWDFLEWRQVTSLAPTLLPGAGSIIAAVLALLLLVACGVLVRAVVRARPRHPLRRVWRWRLAAAALVYLLCISFQQHLPLRRLFARVGVSHQVWDQRSNYQVNGLPLMMLWNWEGLRLEPGGEYSQAQVLSALGTHDVGAGAPLRGSEEPVDVVIYMAESLWDPTRLGVPLSADPIPFVHRLAAAHSSGHLISPAFGGGTANAEFELLTGMSASFAPDGSFPYQHYLLRPVEALPSLFRDAGYHTVAIHPFHAWYWSRDVVYPLLGFDEFQSLTDFPSARLEGPWVSDEEVVDHILQELSDEQRPQFVMAVTMSTHGPYNLARTGSEEVEVLGTTLSPDSRHILTNYVHKLRRMDQALERLVRRLEARPRRTLLVLFGDHLPMLGPNYAVYREAGFLTEPWTDAQRERMAEVPVVLWSNFPMEKRDVHLSMGMLTPRILEAAGMRPRGFFSFLTELSREVPVVRNDLVRTATGEYLPPAEREAVAPVPGSSADWLRRYRLLTYDRLAGENFSVTPAPGHRLAGGP
ncbi:LTA synthase family protein [Pyxidicoccus xibeiensis]|uniref:LTA synthase family protein n=1 Tax=Pyxidicoccus xibeiensis TaxID=2906759 RepID=UPI0020A789BB|nr:sulfatase-like hydrolase/transferase [Pyxidicoccus xibeiensis]MCP3144182.1 LTA synthase family protein [Pyxidicoccus xibeiensis]